MEKPGSSSDRTLQDTVKVRAMDLADIPRVAALERAIFSMPWSANGFRMALEQPDNLYLVAESAKGQIAAYCGLYVMADEGEITNVAVRESCRGRGLGFHILSTLLQRANRQGVERIFLEVRESNHAARRLYEKLGFSRCGLRKGFYDLPRENAVVMCREERAAGKGW